MYSISDTFHPHDFLLRCDGGTLGTSVDWARGAAEHSRFLVALINDRMPRVHGDGVLHYSQLDAVVYDSQPLWCHAPKALSPEEVRIGEHVAQLVPDGATLQMGIGSVPDACLAALSDLGGGNRRARSGWCWKSNSI